MAGQGRILEDMPANDQYTKHQYPPTPSSKIDNQDTVWYDIGNGCGAGQNQQIQPHSGEV